MYRRDYILRLIERFGRMLIALRNRILRREITAEDVRREIHEVAEEAGLDLGIARQLDPQMLLMWLSPTGEIDEPKFWLMAELLYLEGMAGHEGDTGDRGRADLTRARAIYARLAQDWRPSAALPSAGERCDEISRLLQKQGEGPS
jgi:hypothetical protein